MTDFPTIDILHFVDGKSVSKDGFLFSKLYGAHRVDQPRQHFFCWYFLKRERANIRSISIPSYCRPSYPYFIPNQVHTWNVEVSSKAYQLMIDKAYFEKLSLHFRHSFAYYQQHPMISLSSKVFTYEGRSSN